MRRWIIPTSRLPRESCLRYAIATWLSLLKDAADKSDTYELKISHDGGPFLVQFSGSPTTAGKTTTYSFELNSDGPELQVRASFALQTLRMPYLRLAALSSRSCISLRSR